MLTCKETAALLLGWDRILVLSHQNPDGDTLGCAAALLRGLASLGKQVAFRCADPLPAKCAPLFEGIPLGDFAPEHIVAVDVADEKLLGPLQEEYAGRVDLAIDHHGSHRAFARAGWLDGESAAAAEMIWQLLEAMEVSVTREMAQAVYVGVATDTGCFRYRNTTPRTHRIAALAMEAGADAGELNRLHFETKSHAQFITEQKELATLEFFCQDKCTMVRETLATLRETGVTPQELDGSVASVTRQIEGVLLGVMLKEREDGEIKVSVRANPPADASAVCARFGGGGHPGAAGCSFRGIPLEEAAQRMKAACRDYIEEHQL